MISSSAAAPIRLRAGDATLHVDAPVGDGPPLVLVHGAWTGASTWALLTGPLGAAFTVVAYDRRGHSRSTRGEGRPTRRRHEDDLAAVIASLDAGPVYLAGSSYGALLALELAGRRPDLVRGVVAHEPPAVALHPVPEMETLFAAVGERIAAGDAPGATRRFFEDAVLGPGGWALVPEPVQAAAVANAPTFLDMLADPDWGRLDLAATAEHPGPIRITSGDTGPAWLPEIAADVAARLGRELTVIPGAGHTPHHTHPQAFAAVIRDVLSSGA
jgi:pimeloyl-ACP methyl ester carboxylesterase